MQILTEFMKSEEDVGHTEAADDGEADTNFTNENTELDALDQVRCDEGDEDVDRFDRSTHFVESQEPVEEAARHIVSNHVAAGVCSNKTPNLSPPTEVTAVTEIHPYPTRYSEEESQIFMMDKCVGE